MLEECRLIDPHQPADPLWGVCRRRISSLFGHSRRCCRGHFDEPRGTDRAGHGGGRVAAQRGMGHRSVRHQRCHLRPFGGTVARDPFKGRPTRFRQSNHQDPCCLAVWAHTINAGSALSRLLWVWGSLKLTFRRNRRGEQANAPNTRIVVAASLAGARRTITLAGDCCRPSIQKIALDINGDQFGLCEVRRSVRR